MFGIGTGELLLLLLLALLVLGPERMPKLARDLGKTVADLRKTSDELRTEFLTADRTLSAEKLLDVVARQAEAAAPPPPAPPEPIAGPPDVGATQAEVTTPPAEPDETAFDREARLARERISRSEPS